jgi:uncharacterized oligopeptide transporter (OPT) family protein
MKITLYYLALLVFIAILAGYILAGQPNAMSMGQIIGTSAALIVYTVLLSLAGEGTTIDERETEHRFIAARIALITGTASLSIGVLYQLFTHQLDYWLLVSLIGINVSKIISLIYLNYRR